MPLRPAPDSVVGPIHAVTDHPGEGHARSMSPLQHRQAQLRLGRERDRLGHARLSALVRVIGPLLGQVERTIEQGVAVAAGVAEEDADLAVLDPPRRARVLPLHPGRLRAFLEKPGLVQHEHRALVAQVRRHIGLQVIPDGISIPVCPAEEVLHPVRCRITGDLGQLPAVLALYRGQQAAQVGRSAPPRLGTGEPGCDPLQHRIQPTRPAFHLRLRRHATSPPDKPNAQLRL